LAESVALKRYFDATRSAKGFLALREYKSEWDEDLRTFKLTPKHDWSSRAADAFRYLAVAWREPMNAEDDKPNPFIEMCKPKTWNEIWDLHIQDGSTLVKKSKEGDLT